LPRGPAARRPNMRERRSSLHQGGLRSSMDIGCALKRLLRERLRSSDRALA
jgi:hypothetical protein